MDHPTVLIADCADFADQSGFHLCYPCHPWCVFGWKGFWLAQLETAPEVNRRLEFRVYAAIAGPSSTLLEAVTPNRAVSDAPGESKVRGIPVFRRLCCHGSNAT